MAYKPSLQQLQHTQARIKRLYKLIVDYKMKNDGNSPTFRYLAERLNCSTSVINYYLQELEAYGLITMSRDGTSRQICLVNGKYIPPSSGSAPLPFREGAGG